MDLTTPSSTSTDQRTGIDWLFGELHGRYGNRFLDAFRSGHVVNGMDTGVENMKRTWLERIRARRLTRAQLKRGLVACERLKFPPSWPEFLECCQPELDPVVAYEEAVAGLQARAKGEMGEWSHPAVYWAATELRADLMGQTFGAVKERWTAVLKRQMARDDLPPIPPERVALPAPGAAFTSREHAAAMLRELGAAGVLRRMQQTGDKQWARRILDRLERGDNVPSYAARQAREVLEKPDEAAQDEHHVGG